MAPVVRSEAFAPFPHLPTLEQPASWLNAHGHVDRAACAEITIAEARELAGCVPGKLRAKNKSGVASLFTARRKAEKRHRVNGRFASDPASSIANDAAADDDAHCDEDDDLTPQQRRLLATCGGENDEPSVRPLPNERPMSNGQGLQALGVFTITARNLRWLHDQRMPRMLAGDFRTARAPAMRGRQVTPGKSAGARFRCRIDRTQKIAFPRSRNLDPNPNKGASNEKVLALPDDWFQLVCVEKWEYPGRIRPAYYFMCPSSSDQAKIALAPQRAGMRGGRRKRGREDPSSGRCPERCRKLMMVQCTPAERDDARRAVEWLSTLTAAAMATPRVKTLMRAIFTRYGLIMNARTLLCPRCLGVKYGNDPETVRRGWRKRNGKNDVSVRAGSESRNLLKADVPLSYFNRLLLEDLRARREEPERREAKRKSPAGRARRIRMHREAKERRVARDAAAVNRTPEQWETLARMMGPNGDAKLRAAVLPKGLPAEFSEGIFVMLAVQHMNEAHKKRMQRLEANAKREMDRIERMANPPPPKPRKKSVKVSDTGV